MASRRRRASQDVGISLAFSSGKFSRKSVRQSSSASSKPSAQGKVIQAGFKLEALEAFKSDVSVLLKGRREGLAESVDVEISEVKGCEQLVCYISNNLRSQAQMEQGKKVDKTVNLPQEAYFRYSPEFQTLAIHYQGTRKTERKKLGEIFARRLKDAKCGDEIDESAQYRRC